MILLIYLQDAQKYANRDFKIGDGEEYGGWKNYPLCPEESYTIDLVVVDESQKQLQTIHEENNWHGKSVVLIAAKTEPIRIGVLPKNHAMWLWPLILGIIVVVAVIFFVNRRR